MSNIDKQAVQAVADLKAGYTLGHADVAILNELARIALASLEAEELILYRERNPYNGLTTGWQELTDDEYEFIKDNAGENAEFRTVYTAPPAPVSVPAAYEHTEDFSEYHEGWNACRAAMLQGAENAETPTTMQTAPALDSSPKIADSTSGNSPVIPDGWKLVPIELTGDMTNAMSEAILDDLHNVDVWRSVLAVAPQQEVKP